MVVEAICYDVFHQWINSEGIMNLNNIKCHEFCTERVEVKSAGKEETAWRSLNVPLQHSHYSHGDK